MMDSDQQPLVSIIINCYNGEKYLKEAIDSVFAQTYHNWEIVFWDNCSTDDSAGVVKCYNSRILYFKAECKTPLGKARNLAMQQAHGDYIAFLDTDDLWLPLFLEEGINILTGSGEYSAFYSNYYQFTDSSKVIFNENSNICVHGLSDLLICYKVGMSASIIDNKLLKKERIEFCEEYSLVEDYDFFLKLSSINPLYYIPKPLMMYRMHSDSLTYKCKKGWGEELSQLHASIVQYLLDEAQVEVNVKALRWLKVRAVNAYINEKIEYNQRCDVFFLIIKNIHLSYKLLFPLLYVFTTKYIYLKILAKIRIKQYHV